MPFTVFSWNLHRAANPSERTPHIRRVIDRYKPDLIFLSEISHDFGIPGYQELGHVHTLKQTRSIAKLLPQESQLNLKAYLREGSRGVEVKGARALRHAKGQPRAMLKVEVLHGRKPYHLNFLHAKASRAGGKAALSHTLSRMGGGPGEVTLGDMNADYNLPEVQAQLAAAGVNTALVVDIHGVARSETHKSIGNGKVLDYAVGSPDVKMTSVPERVDTRAQPLMDARRGAAGMRRIRKRGAVAPRFLKLSDHRPLVFTLG
jgi:endonuclease/exonuclease/phosphatase family metal-dependent hydrolase